MDATTGWEAVHRDEDGELVGYLDTRIEHSRPSWVARALFGAELRSFPDRASAADFLRAHGLALLAQMWWYRSAAPDADWRPTFLIEARPGWVRVRFGYDPHPSHTAVISGPDLDNLTLRASHPAASSSVR